LQVHTFPFDIAIPEERDRSADEHCKEDNDKAVDGDKDEHAVGGDLKPWRVEDLKIEEDQRDFDKSERHVIDRPGDID
jgi:hypothetical protein